MIRLKHILENKLREQKPLGDIIRTGDKKDPDMQNLNVLFIGDTQTYVDWSFAKLLLRKRIVRGKIVAQPDISLPEMFKLLRASLDEKFDIVTIMGAADSDSDNDAGKAIRMLERIYKFSKQHGAKVIAITNPLKKFIQTKDEDEDKYPASIEIYDWISDQEYTDDVIDIGNFPRGYFERNGQDINPDGHRQIAKDWIDVVEQYEVRTDKKDEPEDEKKPEPGEIIAPAAIPSYVYSSDLITDADFNSSIEDQATRLIGRFEGFSSTAKWDVNNWRIGYGSSTITTAGGEVIRLGNNRNKKPDYTIDREDADRDLARRLHAEFIPRTVQSIGSVANSLPAGVVAALVSIAYNYGSLPGSVKEAARSGDIQRIANAVRAREVDNGGINKNRRNKEANYILAASKELVKTETVIKLKNLIQK